jgi:hypothetical protein
MYGIIENGKCFCYRAVRLTEKFCSSGTFLAPKIIRKRTGSFGFIISRLTPAKRPPDCRLKYLENNEIVLFVHNMHC